MAGVVLPVAMTSVLAVMLMVLAIIMFLFYKKRKLSKSMEEVLEPMSRAKSGSSLNRSSSRRSKHMAVTEKQVRFSCYILLGLSVCKVVVDMAN